MYYVAVKSLLADMFVLHEFPNGFFFGKMKYHEEMHSF